MDRPLLVYTTLPDTDTALAIGEALVSEGLSACINVLPGMRSVYRWRGAIERGEEVVVILKSRTGLRERLHAALKARHPYETPFSSSSLQMPMRPRSAGSRPRPPRDQVAMGRHPACRQTFRIGRGDAARFPLR
jgi:periplasmic divalent cation tolerance protein